MILKNLLCPGIWERLSRPKPRRTPPKYRLLARHDKIRSDDEFLNDDCQTWEKVDRLFVGHLYNGNFHVPMRRKVGSDS
jgi:hypothetical protein